MGTIATVDGANTALSELEVETAGIVITDSVEVETTTGPVDRANVATVELGTVVTVDRFGLAVARPVETCSDKWKRVEACRSCVLVSEVRWTAEDLVEADGKGFGRVGTCD